MSKNKPLWSQDSQLYPVGVLVGIIGLIGTVVSLALLIMGSAKLWMFVFPALVLVGVGLALSAIIQHVKYVLGVNAAQKEDETDEEGDEQGENDNKTESDSDERDN